MANLRSKTATVNMGLLTVIATIASIIIFSFWQTKSLLYFQPKSLSFSKVSHITTSSSSSQPTSTSTPYNTTNINSHASKHMNNDKEHNIIATSILTASENSDIPTTANTATSTTNTKNDLSQATPSSNVSADHTHPTPSNSAHLKTDDGINLKGYVYEYVPPNVSRFDYPWRSLPRVRTLSLTESNNRILYSGVRVHFGSGLGHSTATMNSEILTALRLNLTYTHRTGFYSIHSLAYNETKESITELSGPYQHAGAVEQFFAWGMNEIPREYIQYLTCPSRLNISRIDHVCPICSDDELEERKLELQASEIKSTTDILINNLITLPQHLSYGLPYYADSIVASEIDQFISNHSHPNTVFVMPPANCSTSPAYSGFIDLSRSYFFHKYWDAHNYSAPPLDLSPFQNETFRQFRIRVSQSNLHIPNLGKRPKLARLNQKSIHIAVHARRGDFFLTKRPMISVKVISRVIQQISTQIYDTGDENKFSKLPVTVMIYSEGTKRSYSNDANDIAPPDHDLSKMTGDFIDTDRKLLVEDDVKQMILNNSNNNDTSNSSMSLFPYGLNVKLCISDNTFLSLHEMVAADIFIGSLSGFSTHIVGSLSRGAMILLAGEILDSKNANSPFVSFDISSGNMSIAEVAKVRSLWRSFTRYNEKSI